jgi:hypothetical protein
MSVRNKILNITSDARLQSKECYEVAEYAANIAEASFQEEAEKQVSSIRRECERLYKVQRVLISLGITDEDKINEIYGLVCDT